MMQSCFNDVQTLKLSLARTDGNNPIITSVYYNYANSLEYLVNLTDAGKHFFLTKYFYDL